jgi:hypothetical protein
MVNYRLSITQWPWFIVRRTGQSGRKSNLPAARAKTGGIQKDLVAAGASWGVAEACSQQPNHELAAVRYQIIVVPRRW